jgi:serine/threonine protein kinase
MELIDGVSLERLIRTRSLTLPLALACLDGILAGLEAMHAVGVAHLDVKPSNIILRQGREPVLVDFGLSGRHLRPGCGTPDYSAPEVFAPASEVALETPLPADVYAFGCLAFEALTGEVLFDGPDEQVVFQQHAAHDGWPERLTPFAHDPQSAAVAKMIAACLRRDPRNRPSAAQLRPALARLLPQLSRIGWPLALATTQRRAHG